MLLCMLTLLTVPGQCPGGGCGTGPAKIHVSRHGGGAAFAPNTALYFHPHAEALYDVGPNWAWYFPYGGVTLYPGQPGSGYAARSDYSCINWLVPPEQNAAMVRERLQQLGIPAVPPEPIYWGKNPTVTDAIEKLPAPRPRTVEPPPAVDPMPPPPPPPPPPPAVEPKEVD